jgi:hypothetical protein
VIVGVKEAVLVDTIAVIDGVCPLPWVRAIIAVTVP